MSCRRCLALLSLAFALVPRLCPAQDKVPPQVTSLDIYGTKYLGKPIQYTGRVLDIFKDETDPHYVFALVEDSYGKVNLAINVQDWNAHPVNPLIGAKISVRGRCVSTIQGNARPYLCRQIGMPSLDDITILEPATDHPFDVPLVTKSEDVPPNKLPELGRRRMRGRVLAVRYQNNLLIQSEDDSISRVELREPTPPKPGDSVEVVGNVETDIHHINLTRAIWKPTTPLDVPTVETTNISARLLLQDETGNLAIKRTFYGRTVRIRGTVRSLPVPDFTEQVFFVECDGATCPVDASALNGRLPELKIGCEVDLTGICWMEIENWRPNAVFPHFKGFTLVLRTGDDLKILAWPPWWTPARLLGVIGAMLAFLVGLAIWNMTLRNLAERRGRQIFREQITRTEAELRTAERSRLAVELHDSLSQVLTGIALKIKAAQALAHTDLDKSLWNLSIAESTLRSSREELRYCLWDLRNNILDLPNLQDAIRQTLRPQTGETELAVRFPVSRDKLSDSTVHIVLQIVRELAANAIRHGGATAIRIAGSLEDGILAFSVKDNGCGFDESSAPGPKEGHFGLLGIRDRLARYGGTLEIHSAHGGGTKAVVTLMATAEEEHDAS